MPTLTVVNQTTRPLVLGRANIAPRGTVRYDTTLFRTSPSDGGTILTMFQAGTVKVMYQGVSLTEVNLRRFLVLPGNDNSVIAASECPPSEPLDFDVSQYKVSLDDLTNVDSIPLVLGMVVRIAADQSIVAAVADTLSNLRPALGIVESISIAPSGEGKAQLSGAFADARFVPGLTLTSGDQVYVSASPSSAGILTNVPPSAPGNVIQEVGTVLDASGYNPVAPTPKARINVRVQDPLVYYP